MAKKSNVNPKIDNKVAQLSDFTPAGRKVAEQLALNMPMRTKAEEFLASGKGQPAQKEAVKSVLPHLTDKPSSLKTAATNRVKMIKAGATNPNIRAEGENLPGAGWYFQHHSELSKAAQEHGVGTNTAITASAVMSPQNSPDNEKKAVIALMDAHRNGKITIPHHLVDEINSTENMVKAGVTVNPEHVGVPVHASQLHPAIISALSKESTRTQLPEHNVNLEDIALGGSRLNIAKAVDIIRGKIPEDQAIDPHSAPKVRSYRDAIRDAVPNTPEHDEYMMRAADMGDKLRGDVGKGQMMLDYHNLRGNDSGMLSSTRSTAEDTWMNSISHGQKNEIVPGTDTNVMKTAGSILGYTGAKTKDKVSVDPDPRVKPKVVQHAVNNAATIEAGKTLKKQLDLDYNVPSTLSQETAWIPARRAGNKDKAFNKSVAPEKVSKSSRKNEFTQGTLF
jgi:hypothetical protein